MPKMDGRWSPSQTCNWALSYGDSDDTFNSPCLFTTTKSQACIRDKFRSLFSFELKSYKSHHDLLLMLTGIQFALKMSFDFTVAVQTHESPGKDENGFSGRTHVIVNLLCWLQLVGDPDGQEG